MKSTKPLVYSCSGCSNVAQLANNIAVKLDREDKAEMSCISGIGGNVKSLIKKLVRAKEQKQKIIAIDGCPLQCAKSCLWQQNIVPDIYIELSEKYGVKKRYKQDFSKDEFISIYLEIEKTYFSS